MSTLVASLIEQEVQTEPTLRELAENQTDMSKKIRRTHGLFVC